MKTFFLSKKDYNTISIAVDGIARIIFFTQFRVDKSTTSNSVTLSLTTPGFGIHYELGLSDIVYLGVEGIDVNGTLDEFASSVETYMNSTPEVVTSYDKGYKELVLLLSQNSATPIVVTELVNELGFNFVSSEYWNTGNYSIYYQDGAFPVSKTIVMMSSGGANPNTLITAGAANTTQSIDIQTYQGGSSTNGGLFRTALVVRVYP